MDKEFVKEICITNELIDRGINDYCYNMDGTKNNSPYWKNTMSTSSAYEGSLGITFNRNSFQYSGGYIDILEERVISKYKITAILGTGHTNDKLKIYVVDNIGGAVIQELFSGEVELKTPICARYFYIVNENSSNHASLTVTYFNLFTKMYTYKDVDIKLEKEVPISTEIIDYKYLGITKENGIYTYNKSGKRVKVAVGVEDIGSKVDKEDGKVLSSNDFTDELSSKLMNLSRVTYIQDWGSKRGGTGNVVPIIDSDGSNIEKPSAFICTSIASSRPFGDAILSDTYKLFDGRRYNFVPIIYVPSTNRYNFYMCIDLGKFVNIKQIRCKVYKSNNNGRIFGTLHYRYEASANFWQTGTFTEHINKTIKDGDILEFNINKSLRYVYYELVCDIAGNFDFGFYYFNMIGDLESCNSRDILIEGTEDISDVANFLDKRYLGITKEDGIYTYDFNTGRKVKIALGLNDLKLYATTDIINFTKKW